MRNLYAYIASSILVVVTMGAMLTSCNEQPREETLKVYNWGDYIDEDLLDEFEVWYEEQTGTPVNIVYQTFDINEVMLAKIEKGEADFDVVCPSEYIIERMMRHDILVPIVSTSSFRTSRIPAQRTTLAAYHPTLSTSSTISSPPMVTTLTTTL